MIQPLKCIKCGSEYDNPALALLLSDEGIQLGQYHCGECYEKRKQERVIEFLVMLVVVGFCVGMVWVWGRM